MERFLENAMYASLAACPVYFGLSLALVARAEVLP